jgi:hypothetical protein
MALARCSRFCLPLRGVVITFRRADAVLWWVWWSVQPRIHDCREIVFWLEERKGRNRHCVLPPGSADTAGISESRFPVPPTHRGPIAAWSSRRIEGIVRRLDAASSVL